MKKIIFWLFVAFSTFSWGQTNPLENLIKNAKTEGFQFENVSGVINEITSSRSSKSSILSDPEQISFFYYDSKKFITDGHTLSLSIPTFELGLIEVELIEREAVNEQVIIKKSNEIQDDSEPDLLSKHYRGIVKGQKQSLVALSVFDNEISGIISIEGIGDFNITKEKYSEYHSIIKADNMDNNNFTCETIEIDQGDISEDIEISSDNVTNNCPNIYFEVGNDIYTHFDSNLADTKNYVTALFNEVATVYEMEGINLKLSEIFVWTADDPYSSSSNGFNLAIFRFNRASFNGDLAHLLKLSSSGGGGVAYPSGSYGLSSISPEFNEFPNYSRQVKVVAHELGHNFGADHTHSCNWNGDNSQIDDYGNYSSSGTLITDRPGGVTGGCIDPDDSTYVPLLNVTPTIMSYYDSYQHGQFPLSNGFGEEPGNLIRNAITNQSRFTSCDTSCPSVEIVNNDVTIGSSDSKTAEYTLTATNIISSGATAGYHAGEEVLLTDGFVAELGSSFDGYIEGCEITTSSKSVNLSNFSDTQELLSSDEEVLDVSLNVYPNPSDGIFNVQGTDNIISYAVKDLTGKQIITGNTTDNDFAIDITNFSSGFYLLELLKENGNIIRKKIIKN